METAIPAPGTSQNSGIGAGSSGLVRVMSNSQLEAQIEAAEDRQQEEPLPGLVTHVKKAWQAARSAKEPQFRRLLEELRAKKGEYSADKLTKIREQIGGSEVFMNVTKTKIKGLRSWLKDIMLTPGERPWGVRPTPDPEMPPLFKMAISQRVMAEVVDVQSQGIQVTPDMQVARVNMVTDAVHRVLKEQAAKAAERMEAKIEDRYRQGGWYTALSEFIDNFSTHNTAFFRGPVMRSRKVLKWEMSPDMKFKPVVKEEVREEWYAPSPFDIYPSPDSRATDDGYLIERHLLRRSSLAALRGTAGYDEGAINAVLSEHGAKGLYNWLWEDNQRQTMENRDRAFQEPDVLIEAIEFNGKVQGKDLIEWGIKEKLDPVEEYEANVWLIGRWAIKASLNDNPLNQRNYFKASFERIQGAFWGEGMVDAIRDVQAICNALARAIVNNAGFASGPQVEVFEDRMVSGAVIDSLKPLDIWQTKSDPTGSGHRAINFNQPTLVADSLVRVYDYFKNAADDQSGVPAYVYGDTDVTGAGRTASGLSMLMSGASKGLKQVVADVDEGVTRPSTVYEYNHLMLNDPDPSIKGDTQVVASGAAAMIAKEQTTIRQQEFLNATTNPVDLQILGMEGRARLLRGIAKNMDLPDNIVPDEQDILTQLAVEAPLSTGNDPANPAPVDQAGDRPNDLNTFPNTG